MVYPNEAQRVQRVLKACQGYMMSAVSIKVPFLSRSQLMPAYCRWLQVVSPPLRVKPNGKMAVLNRTDLASSPLLLQFPNNNCLGWDFLKINATDF